MDLLRRFVGLCRVTAADSPNRVGPYVCGLPRDNVKCRYLAILPHHTASGSPLVTPTGLAS